MNGWNCGCIEISSVRLRVLAGSCSPFVRRRMHFFHHHQVGEACDCVMNRHTW